MMHSTARTTPYLVLDSDQTAPVEGLWMLSIVDALVKLLLLAVLSHDLSS